MTIDAIMPGVRVLCAVSGGVDSMYLLHRMTALGAQRGFAVGCAHFNHGLRGAESDRDEAFVRAQCEKLGVPFYAGRGDVASVRGMGTEAAARELRYAFLAQCAQAHSYDWIATAHTADDNAETLLLNLARGCGLRGLTGIQAPAPDAGHDARAGGGLPDRPCHPARGGQHERGRCLCPQPRAAPCRAGA